MVGKWEILDHQSRLTLRRKKGVGVRKELILDPLGFRSGGGGGLVCVS
jgi:hypothetical protein